MQNDTMRNGLASGDERKGEVLEFCRAKRRRKNHTGKKMSLVEGEQDEDMASAETLTGSARNGTRYDGVIQTSFEELIWFSEG